jgi:hypothetical protein
VERAWPAGVPAQCAARRLNTRLTATLSAEEKHQTQTASCRHFHLLLILQSLRKREGEQERAEVSKTCSVK